MDQFVERVGGQVRKSSLYRWKDEGIELDFIPQQVLYKWQRCHGNAEKRDYSVFTPYKRQPI